MKADRESGENGLAVGWRFAVERFAEMFEAGRSSNAMAGQQSELGRTLGEAFERGHAVGRRHFTDFIHALVNVERRQARGSALDVGDALAQLPADQFDRITRHNVAKVAEFG